MENSEEYLLRVLRRTQLGLQDSLMPAHASKLVKLVEKFENTASLKNEIALLKRVNGFQKCAISMEWLYKRVQNPIEEFSPEQFESDILMLNEKIFEAFLNQPFDLPDSSATQTFDSQFSSSASDLSTTSFDFSSPSFGTSEVTPSLDSFGVSPLSEPQWGSSLDSQIPSFESEVNNLPQSSPIANSSPSLFDAFDSALLESFQRISTLLNEFGLKLPSERPIAMAVVRMTAKTALENARTLNNVFAQEFFQNLVALINFIDQEGKIKSEDTASIMLDIGDRMKNALEAQTSGVTFLKKITEFISNPKELMKKK